MNILQVAVGTVAVCNERIVVVCEVALDALSVRDLVSGQIIRAAAADLSALKDPAHERRACRQDAALARCSARQWQRARQHETLVVAVLTRHGSIVANVAAVAREHGVGERSLRRWVALYRQRPSTSALLSAAWGNQPGSRRLEPAVETIIGQAIDALFLTRPKATYQVVFEEVERRCERAGVRAPSRNALIRRIKALDPWVVARHQLGRQEALRRVCPKPGTPVRNTNYSFFCGQR